MHGSDSLPRRRRFALGLALSLVAASGVAAAQDTPQPPQPTPPSPTTPPGPATPPRGSAREAMWPSASAEDWKKPCLITWQRTWEDAVAVSKETGKPILVCINMDGEIASEHYAGVRYRQPETAALYEPYVCVIASVYRHTPRDHDDAGNRIPCPRFGGVTCGEHIAIEPLLFEKFMDGQRIAPRHIMVELDGKETYDVYYANDTASVFQAIREGISKRAETPPVVVRGDRPVVERVASRDVKDRQAVETAYAQGDAALRSALLEAAAKSPDAAPVDLLRLAVFGLDTDMSRLAREALAKSESPAAAGVIAEALRVPMDAAERDKLIAALERLGEKSPRAQWLAVVHRGFSEKTTAMDVEGWAKAGSTYEAPQQAKGWEGLQQKRDAEAEAAKAKPDDAASRLTLAETYLKLALEARKSAADDPRAARVLAQNLFDDARITGRRAEELGAKGWRVDTVLALADYYGGKVEDAYPRAEAAVKDLPPGEASWNSMAVITVFAESRWKAIKQAVREKKRWPARWLTDLNAAYTILLRHPETAESQVVWHYDFLDWLQASDQAWRLLDQALTRFPASPAFHERLRKFVVARRGIDQLEPAYDALLGRPDASPALLPFAAVAAGEAADYYRRGALPEKAAAALDRTIAMWEKAAVASAERKDQADHAIALALAGRARLALDAGDLDASYASIMASFARRADSAGTRDGVGINPVETAQMLILRLREAKRDDLVANVEAALKQLDPDFLRPDRP